MKIGDRQGNKKCKFVYSNNTVQMTMKGKIGEKHYGCVYL